MEYSKMEDLFSRLMGHGMYVWRCELGKRPVNVFYTDASMSYYHTRQRQTEYKEISISRVV